MRYTIVDTNHGAKELDTITSAPVDYLWQFEPLDVVNRLVAWDEHGRLYHFMAEEAPTEGGGLSIVNVGSWAKTGPHMIKVGSSPSELREVLVRFLTKSHPTFWQRLRKRDTDIGADDLNSKTIAELVTLAELKLNKNVKLG